MALGHGSLEPEFMSKDLLISQVGSLQGSPDLGRSEQARKGAGPSFDQLLRDTAKPGALPEAVAAPAQALKFSAHALDRVRDRQISMSKELMGKLEKAVETAAAKGAKDSLVLTPEAAFIVSVKNKTVVTVLDRAAMNGNVFTNIDSTVVV